MFLLTVWYLFILLTQKNFLRLCSNSAELIPLRTRIDFELSNFVDWARFGIDRFGIDWFGIGTFSFSTDSVKSTGSVNSTLFHPFELLISVWVWSGLIWFDLVWSGSWTKTQIWFISKFKNQPQTSLSTISLIRYISLRNCHFAFFPFSP